LKRTRENSEPFGGWHLANLVYEEEIAVGDVLHDVAVHGFGYWSCANASMNVIDKLFGENVL
jgi:hypothetical protein